MTKTQEHKLIIWGLLAVSVAIIAYLLLQPSQAAATGTQTDATPANPVSYSIPALQIPGNTYVVNAPPTGLPNVYNIGAPTFPIAASNGDCSCGCGSNGDGSITYSFGGFNTAETNTFNQLQMTAQAADNASMQAILNSFGYSEGVAVSDATPLNF